MSQEFIDFHTRISAMNMGFIVICHEKTKSQETYSGDSFDKVVPALSGATEEFYAGVIDNICCYHFHGKKRYLQIRGDDYIQAGTRCEKNFLTPDGKPIERIPMGKSSEEAYKNLVVAFNNDQEETCARKRKDDDDDEEERPSRKKKFKKKSAKKKSARKRR